MRFLILNMSDSQIAFLKKLNIGREKFKSVEEKTREILGRHGFGVITEINVQAVLKKKINVDMKPYLILGACSPTHAHDVITADPITGIFLPCNVVIYVDDEDNIIVAAMNPSPVLGLANNNEVQKIADEVGEILKKVLEEVEKEFS